MNPSFSIVEALLFAGAGLAIGLVYWCALRHLLRLFLARAGGHALSLLLVRIALVMGLLLPAVHRGAWPLLAAFAGLLVARHLTLRRVAEEP